MYRHSLLALAITSMCGCPNGDNPGEADDQSTLDGTSETHDTDDGQSVDVPSDTESDDVSETLDGVLPPDGDTLGSECTVAADCDALLAERAPSPAGCAEAFCDNGACRFRAVDADGDGFRVAGCMVAGVGIAGDDCDDTDGTFYPGQARPCGETPEGTAIAFPSTPPKGSCRWGVVTCGADGTVSVCEGAIGPKPHDTCDTGNDDDCDGVPNGVDCRCVVGASEACGTCGTGTRKCLSADGGGAVWGGCTGENPPASYGDECDNGCFLGTVGCQNECLAPPLPGNYQESCGNRCHQGAINCQGQCSALPEPGNYGQPCSNACHTGTYGCSGCNAASPPPNYGQSCNNVCHSGQFNCQGQCTAPAPPSNYGAGCGSCGGTINCQGQCSVATPSNFGSGCGSCGGTINCQSQCSVATPGNLNQPCNNNCGRIQCNGQCSASEPAGWGQVWLYPPFTESFTCCWIDYTKTHTAPCGPGTGYVFDRVEVWKTGGGLCTVVSQPVAGSNSCSVTVRYQNQGTDGASCDTRIFRRRVCN